MSLRAAREVLRAAWVDRIRLHDGQHIPDVPLAVVSGGRGSGKTFAGAHWLANLIDQNPGNDWGVVAPTFGDARDTNLEANDSGLLTLRPWWRDGWNRSMGELHLPDGGHVWIDGSLDGAERIQGKNLAGVWVDEIGLSRGVKAVQAWEESVRFAVRISPARILVTGTPKRGNPLVGQVEAEADHVARMATVDNPHLDDQVKGAWLEAYGDTTLGRQELYGELLPDVEGALWTHDLIAAGHRPDVDRDSLTRVAVGVDPPATVGTCGIVAAGIDPDGVVVVLEDASVAGSPEKWASAVAACAGRWDGTVVAEVNQGGNMVTSVLDAAGAGPVKTVRAAQGKQARAQPVALLSEVDPPRLTFAGRFPALEDQLTGWVPGDPSPDRLDAMVWAVTWLTGTRSGPVSVSVPQGHLGGW